MYELTYYIKEIGNISLDTFWFPLLIWTLCCGLAFALLKSRDKLNPLFHYHLRTAALLSLPFGIGISALLSKIPEWFSSSNLETAFFVVQNPIEVVRGANNSSSGLEAINWQEPSFFIGLITVLIALVSLFMIGRLISSYIALKSLYKNLSLTELQKIKPEVHQLNKSSIKLAFHDHPLVPFTFGWKQPVIVLPKILQNNSEQMEMALQHELIHIKRGDYLLQLALSIIESIFWFHPLIRYGNQEIDTYREISCDQEVLSKSNFSIKSYANLLYELVPLSTGASRLSVSMAVKNSTLKKRIKTMKYHKLHKASFRQSIAFLMLMIVGITLPIACSDLRGPQGLSTEELLETKLIFESPTVKINDLEVATISNNVEAMAYDGFVMVLGEHGSFVFSPTHFDGAKRAGSINGSLAEFDVNQMNVTISSSSDIIGDKSTPLFAKHFIVENAPDFQIFSKIPQSILKSTEQLEEFATLKTIPSNLDADLDLDAELNLDADIDTKSEDDFFVVVEQMPRLIGGMAGLQSKVEYTEIARRAGIEGRVTVQFIVNENGDVENAEVVRGIGGGLDESALAAVREAKFEPGMQRGRPVRVQYAVSVNFRLEDSDFTSTNLEQSVKEIDINITESNNGKISGIITDEDGNILQGASVVIDGLNRGTATSPSGTFTFSNIEPGNYTLKVSFVGYKTGSTNIRF